MNSVAKRSFDAAVRDDALPDQFQKHRADVCWHTISCLRNVSHEGGITARVICYDQARSKRSRFITLFQAATKS